jgi:hypothetical protein
MRDLGIVFSREGPFPHPREKSFAGLEKTDSRKGDVAEFQ